jgi:DNA polymerase-3 subunit alpha
MEQRMRQSGQVGMFDLWAQTSPAFVLDQEIKQDEDVSIKEKLEWERDLLGVYFSSSPLDSLTPELSTYYKSRGFASCGEISTDMANETVVIAGMVASVRQAYTRDRRPFIIATVEDLNSSIEVIVWPRLHEDTKELWQEGNILVVKGAVKIRDGRVQLNCQQARLYQQTEPAPSIKVNQSPEQSEMAAKQALTPSRRHLTINIKQTEEIEKDVERLRQVVDILKNYPGEDTVSLVITTEEEMTNLEIPRVTIDYCPELASELSNILGEENLRLEQQLI